MKKPNFKFKWVDGMRHDAFIKEVNELKKIKTPDGVKAIVSYENPDDYYMFEHCTHLEHTNYVCDVEKVDWIFCPICKTKWTGGYNQVFDYDAIIENTGLTIPKYWKMCKKILDEFECLTKLVLSRDAILGSIIGLFENHGEEGEEV